VAIAKLRHEHIVAIGEDRRRHVDRLVDGPLDRKAPAVDLRTNPLDDDTTRERCGNLGLRNAHFDELTAA
jgi:hypothetical protein